METNWQELIITINREAEEAASNILIELGSQGVAINDSADYLGKVGKYGELFPEVEQDERVTVTAYYPETADMEKICHSINERLTELADFGLQTGEITLSTQVLAEEDWAENWKKYYQPVRITHDLTIVPSWTDYKPGADEKTIKLDPGMAFGTGTHPTTKMSLFALEQVLRGYETVIDVGTGSGVLSIASSLLGAQTIYAYDLDERAVSVAQENIDLNEGRGAIRVETGDLLRGVTTEADVIVANILADILLDLVEDAYRLIKDEGYLIMSGIISEKLRLVLEASQKAGFFLETHMSQGEWHTLILKKTNAPEGVIGG
ncbi:50S ribosomal protein L11 methyltransferase [Streptococcus chenjunshii]|uniref:Ribosomal protein L11 methyltransferase n=1 Tax=Streptococcus chenjunshii TaxID=2173853 RepID=A0A372KNF2_9STRE|nr:50S ribosomal protein L11 methyltransferase [Streptococcus chenjunshii]AXQ77786.1 50S ribosomal protein L11 methyltransferase [Streptococcus chenjunshii]RFU51296.1 50S ribosomal protein L11 methyltransferase [Streptococcus chenjunshii]RFU53830.1 50S ribosomal protein L11 methyltransferase [Streptococcus chenjunshii]